MVLTSRGVRLTVVEAEGQLGGLGQLGGHSGVEEARVDVVDPDVGVLGAEGLQKLDSSHLGADVGAHAGEGREEDAGRSEVDERRLLFLSVA